MMNTIKHIYLTLTLILGLCLALPAGAADDGQPETVTVMALGPLDGRAVVKTADGKRQVLKIGNTIPGTQATVKQVLTDRLVVEQTGKERRALAAPLAARRPQAPPWTPGP